MGLYRNLVFPRLTDLAMRNGHLGPYRVRVIGAAEGRVFEIGDGSGLNLARYPLAVRELVALEPDPKMIGMAQQKAVDRERPLTFLEASAERIPLAEPSFDTVVSTWTMCTILDIRRALAEMRRVLKPSGRLLFVGHGLAPEPSTRKRTGAGSEVDRLQTGYMPGHKLMTFMYEVRRVRIDPPPMRFAYPRSTRVRGALLTVR